MVSFHLQKQLDNLSLFLGRKKVMQGEIELIYAILEYVSILLFLFLLGHCVSRSINYTLQVFCIVAIFNNINESTLIFVHDHQDFGAHYGDPGCTISAFFEQLLPLTMNCLCSCMAFNIWYLVVLKGGRTERGLLRWYCLFSFTVPVVTTSVAAILLRGAPHFSAFPSQFYCNLADSTTTRGTFAGPMLAVSITGILLSRTCRYCRNQLMRLWKRE